MQEKLSYQLYNICRQISREEALLILKELFGDNLPFPPLPTTNPLPETPPIVSKKIIRPLEWNSLPEGIDVLYKGLMGIEQETLGCTLENFRAIFLTPETAHPVKWLGKPGELACVIGTLNAKKAVSTLGKYWPTVSEFFYHTQGEKYKSGSLSVQYSRNQCSNEFDTLVQKLINQIKDDWKQKLTRVNLS